MTTWTERRTSDLIDGLRAGVSVRSISGEAGGPAVLKTSAIKAGRFDPRESKPILPADLPRAKCPVAADSIIISRMNTPALVGDVGYVEKDFDSLFLPDRLWIARSKRGSGTDIRWLTYHFSSQAGARALRELATGTSWSMKNIPKDKVLGLKVLTPTPPEQRAIADALTDAENLISSLERLIAKKQAIKQGMVQQLLSGRTRLPGFGNPWREARLGHMGKTYGGLTGKSKQDFINGNARLVTFMQVMAKDRLTESGQGRVTVRPEERQNSVRKGDILFNGSSETPEEVALAAAVEASLAEETYLNSFCFGFRLNSDAEIDPVYLARYFRSTIGRATVSTLAQGATRYNISKTQLLKVWIELPPLEEQQAISSVISDADDEIETLKRRLESARNIKQGMMQELLSGRIRLSVPEVSS